MARGRNPKHYHHVNKPTGVNPSLLNPASGFVVPEEKKSFDYDYPLTQKVSLNKETGVKMLGHTEAKASGFGRTRVIRNRNPVSDTRRRAYALEEKDSLNWAAALAQLPDEPSKSSKKSAVTTIKTEAETETYSSSIPGIPSPALTASTNVSTTTLSTAATSVSATSNTSISVMKRKVVDEEPELSQPSEKRRRLLPVCKHGNVIDDSYSTDVDMCDCDDLLHNFSSG